MPAEERTGYVYVPNGDAWERYRKDGGQAEVKPRPVSMQQDNLVQLIGLPNYWWKLTDLLQCPAPAAQADLNVRFEAKVPNFAGGPGARNNEGSKCYAEIPESRLNSVVRHGDLAIEFEEEEDEDCSGEDCESCDGEGCKQTLDPVLASELITHLLDSYDNSADSFAEAHGCDRTIVDDMYRDLLVLISSIRARA
jgi:hypothetical protein